MAVLDEALAASSAADDIDPFSLEEIYCKLFTSCERTHDVSRAEQWVSSLNEIVLKRNVPAVGAWCRTHYGSILTAAGRWPEAETELLTAAEIYDRGYTALKQDALARLADLRVRQGRFEEAEQLLVEAEGWHAAIRPRAALHLVRGEIDLARHVLESALEQEGTDDAVSAPLLALLVDVHLAAGDIENASKVSSRLEQAAARYKSDYLNAAAALAQGQLCLATGEGDPRRCLSNALSHFSKAKMPMELAQVQLEMARAHVSENPTVAISEAKAALASFERLQAARHADAATALLRSLGSRVRTGPKGIGALTRRESEILELLGQGLTNPEIGDRLFISRKTVEHHVGNVLSKLQLRSRAEAAAYAVRSEGKPAPK
jgi:DNA-binding NarL/FixJ family response regulator